MFKVCQKCKKKQRTEEFAKCSKRKDGLQAWCRTCNNEANRKCYSTSSVRKEKTRKRVKETKRQTNLFFIEYFSSHPCIDCGETNYLCLDFDHRENKKEDVSRMRGCSLETIKKEIEKCDVRCSNCHRKKTAKEQNWYGNVL